VGHSQYAITDRYVHAEQFAFPLRFEASEDRLFSATE
jgi:hypothetical protein